MKGPAQQRPCCPTRSVWTGLPTPTLHAGQGQRSGASPHKERTMCTERQEEGWGPEDPPWGPAGGGGVSYPAAAPCLRSQRRPQTQPSLLLFSLPTSHTLVLMPCDSTGHLSRNL